MKRIFYFAQPNSFNKDKSFLEFKDTLMGSSQPVRREDDIMKEVRGIITLFNREGERSGDI